MKWIIALALVAVLAALAAAGWAMLRGGAGDSTDKTMARALAWRVGISVALFLFVLFAWWMGWIQPTGLPR